MKAHAWDKDTGVKIPAKPWIGLRAKWIRTCLICGRKEAHSKGPVFFGWYSCQADVKTNPDECTQEAGDGLRASNPEAPEGGKEKA